MQSESRGLGGWHGQTALSFARALALVVVASARADIIPDAPPPPYHFTAEEEALLDSIQRGCFNYFWREVGSPSCLAKDRKNGPVASIAAVGFQLSSLPIGVERGWITRQQGAERARTVLHALIDRADNKKCGLYYHFPDLDTGGPSHHGYETVVSTIDSALLIAGAIPAAEYFGGEVAELTRRLVADADWKAFASLEKGGLLSMGWRCKDPNQPTGAGEFLTYYWDHAGDEQRLIYFLAAAAPNPDHAVAPELYYNIRRAVKRHADMPEYVVTWNGTLFTYFFAHCWIDYGRLGTDDPSRFSVTPSPSQGEGRGEGLRVDWCENSRRAVLTQRQRCLEMRARFKSFAEDRWGLSACDGKTGYIVPAVRPNISEEENWHDGTIAPYAAGSAIMFTPRESLAALRAFRALKDDQGRPLIWRDPEQGGYGFADSFSLDLNWVSSDNIGIDVGPLLVAIENARTGLIWKLFMQSQTAKVALMRLRLPSAR
ncbi:MAG TPA: glucoamylase family protein [Phycisphaerae bacterium]